MLNLLDESEAFEQERFQTAVSLIQTDFDLDPEESFLLIQYDPANILHMLGRLELLEREGLIGKETVDRCYLEKGSLSDIFGIFIHSRKPAVILIAKNSNELTAYHELFHALLYVTGRNFSHIEEIYCESQALHYYARVNGSFDIQKFAEENFLSPQRFFDTIKETISYPSKEKLFLETVYSPNPGYIMRYWAAWRHFIQNNENCSVFQEGWDLLMPDLQKYNPLRAKLWEKMKNLFLDPSVELDSKLNDVIKVAIEEFHNDEFDAFSKNG